MGHSKINKFDKNFRTFDNQYLMKFWLLSLSTMEIQNPKVGTVPKKIREDFMAYRSPRALFPYLKIVFVLAGALKQ